MDGPGFKVRRWCGGRCFPDLLHAAFVQRRPLAARQGVCVLPAPALVCRVSTTRDVRNHAWISILHLSPSRGDGTPIKRGSGCGTHHTHLTTADEKRRSEDTCRYCIGCRHPGPSSTLRGARAGSAHHRPPAHLETLLRAPVTLCSLPSHHLFLSLTLSRQHPGPQRIFSRLYYCVRQ